MNSFCSIKSNISLPEFLIGLAVAILLWMVFTALQRRWDKSVIAQNLRDQGARLDFIRRCRRLETWSENSAGNYYRIRFQDRNGWNHEAVCLIANDDGIYYADDTVGSAPAAQIAAAHSATADGRIAKLEAENHRLQEELQRVRQS